MQRLFYTTLALAALAMLTGCGKKAPIDMTPQDRMAGPGTGNGTGTGTGAGTVDANRKPTGQNGVGSCRVVLDRATIAVHESTRLTLVADGQAVAGQVAAHAGNLVNTHDVPATGLLVSPSFTTDFTASLGDVTCQPATLTVNGIAPIGCVLPDGLVNPACAQTVLLTSRTPTPDKQGTVGMNRLCSVNGRKNGEIFSEAIYPILALETDTNPPLLLETVDLRGYRLTSSDWRLKVDRARRKVAFTLDVDPLRGLLAWYGIPESTYVDRWITIRVCDDRDRDGGCLFEPVKYQLAEQAVTFQPGGFRGSYGIDVWSGREGKFLDFPKRTKPNKDFADTCDEQESPLVIDLAGDGIELGDDTTARFKHDGVNEVSSGWAIGKDDALLVRLTPGATELTGLDLFGNHTRLPDGTFAEDGFQALAQYDVRDTEGRSRADGRITKEDPVWSTLRVWLPRAPYGKMIPSQLKTLDEVGITEISLDYVRMNELDANGNRTKQRSSVKIGNRSVTMADVWFAVGR